MAKSDIVRELGQKAIHTMADSYRIVEVKSEWVIDREDMGTKTKFWYRDPDGEVEWLFKYPRPNTGEYWSEKVAAEVASVIGVRHAEVELAEFEGERGSATKSFARGGRALYHGNEVLEWTVGDYDPKKNSTNRSIHWRIYLKGWTAFLLDLKLRVKRNVLLRSTRC